MTEEQLRKIIKQERKQARDSVNDFVEGAIEGDVNRMDSSLPGLEYGACLGYGWPCVFRRIVKKGPVPENARMFFLRQFLDIADLLRSETRDDLTYFKGLRVLLPSYDGPPVLLYRGESANNRRHTRYGPSWSADKNVARSFASDLSVAAIGGGVLLATVAEPAAIIAAPAILDDRYREQEYIVDRRFLSKVWVEERFPQIMS